MLEDVTNAREREALYKSIAANVRARPPKPNPITKADWKGAFTSFWLVVITSASAAIPFFEPVYHRLLLGPFHDGQALGRGAHAAFRRHRSRGAGDIAGRLGSVSARERYRLAGPLYGDPEKGNPGHLGRGFL